jgi:hypothetical protein
MSDESILPDGFDWREFTPEDSPKTPMDLFADPAFQSLSTASVEQGGPAYDFSSAIYDFSSGRKVETGRMFNLLDACREQPVALIFGSYT